MGTDRYAYLSRLRGMDPIPKIFLSMAALLVCLFCESITVGIFTMVVLSAFTVLIGGQKVRVVLHFMKVPLVFLVIGCLTIIFRPIGEEEALWAVHLLGYRWGITEAYLRLGLMVFCKAMGTISAMYFLSLNTPMTDLTMALERLRVPKLFVELMELIYRFIFVLADAAGRIRTAQESRLGYLTVRQGMHSLGTLVSMVFIRSLKQGNRVYAALESRGYTGSLTTLPGQYSPGRWLYGLGLATAAAQLLVLYLERRWLL